MPLGCSGPLVTDSCRAASSSDGLGLRTGRGSRGAVMIRHTPLMGTDGSFLPARLCVCVFARVCVCVRLTSVRFLENSFDNTLRYRVPIPIVTTL